MAKKKKLPALPKYKIYKMPKFKAPKIATRGTGRVVKMKKLKFK